MRTADGDYGLVVRNGTNLRYTDLAPGARAPMVCYEHANLVDHDVLTSVSSIGPRRSIIMSCVRRPLVCADGNIDRYHAVAGKIVLEMEDGSETLVENVGDVVILRGTIHAWRNPGPGWTRWLTVLIDAKPAVVGGKAIAPDYKT